MREGIVLTVNGEPREVPAGLSVRSLVEHLGLLPERVAVERNRRVVRRAAWAGEIVAAGDAIEIVNFVGGG